MKRAAGPDPDAELLWQVAAGDAQAVRTMVSRKLQRLLALATRMLGDASEAEDVAQECFVRIWHQAPRWRPGAAKFDTWLHRVALNLCTDRLRRRREVLMAAPPDSADPDPLPDQRLADRQSDALVVSALAAIPERQRAAIILFHYQELTNIEAAAAMEISVEALESLLARGRRALRKLLIDEAPTGRHHDA